MESLKDNFSLYQIKHIVLSTPATQCPAHRTVASTKSAGCSPSMESLNLSQWRTLSAWWWSARHATPSSSVWRCSCLVWCPAWAHSTRRRTPRCCWGTRRPALAAGTGQRVWLWEKVSGVSFCFPAAVYGFFLCVPIAVHRVLSVCLLQFMEFFLCAYCSSWVLSVCLLQIMEFFSVSLLQDMEFFLFPCCSLWTSLCFPSAVHGFFFKCPYRSSLNSSCFPIAIYGVLFVSLLQFMGIPFLGPP